MPGNEAAGVRRSPSQISVLVLSGEGEFLNAGWAATHSAIASTLVAFDIEDSQTFEKAELHKDKKVDAADRYQAGAAAGADSLSLGMVQPSCAKTSPLN
ncbi:MAG TPA: hypothetical protein VGR96_11350 [Acidobacteriaceae bacterium]|nr:hypothetical protein [Acidobacteriaceae bacterium]